MRIESSSKETEFFGDKSDLGQEMNSDAVTAPIPSAERARATAIGNDALHTLVACTGGWPHGEVSTHLAGQRPIDSNQIAAPVYYL
jgi:hypothetical protein